MDSTSGLQEVEAEIMSKLVDAWNLYLSLPENGKDVEEFIRGIHILEYIIGQRILRRLYPEYWVV